MANNANFNKNEASKIKSSSVDDGSNDEYKCQGLVEISNIFVVRSEFSFETQQFSKVYWFALWSYDMSNRYIRKSAIQLNIPVFIQKFRYHILIMNIV